MKNQMYHFPNSMAVEAPNRSMANDSVGRKCSSNTAVLAKPNPISHWPIFSVAIFSVFAGGCLKSVPEGTQPEIKVPHVTEASISSPVASSVPFLPIPSPPKLSQLAKSKTPAAVFHETEFDFGEMDPYTFGDHKFVVKNAGTAPLTLSLGESTCHCTVSQVPEDPILPGESAEVLIRWQTSTNNKFFSEQSTIKTSDPNHEIVAFHVRGKVRVHFGASPPRFNFPKARPGENESTTTLLSSQVWADFHIEDVRSSMPGIHWHVSEPASSALEEIKAKSGKELTLTIPNDLQQGSFTDWVRIKIKPEGHDQSTEYELPLVGKIVRPVSVYGKNIDQTGTIRLGVIRSQVGLTQRYLVKVRDRQPSLLVRKVSTVPDFVEAQLHTEDASKGVYVLEITIPQNVEPCDFISQPGGMIQLEFEHPRISSLDLMMEFAVADRPESR